MIIKSHIRGGYRAAADYLKDIGQNETTRLVHISDPDAKTLDDAFHNMWSVASSSKVKKPLHHISINPMKDERLTDEQVKRIVERCEQKYGYKPGEHQCVIVEHVKDGRQHFHVIWNRVNLETGKAVWPGHHWLKSKQVCREMEIELGLKRPQTGQRQQKLFIKQARPLGKAHNRTIVSRTSNVSHVSIKNGRHWTGDNKKAKHGGFVVHPTYAAQPVQVSRGDPAKPYHAKRGVIVGGQPSPSIRADKLFRYLPTGGWVTPSHKSARQVQGMLSPAAQPIRPTTRNNMSQGQYVDFIAACEGKITWQQYFVKWGKSEFLP